MADFGDFLGGIFGLASTAMAADASSANVHDTNRANMKLAQYQNDWNYYMEQDARRYNSPANQVNLLMQAGLNPLYYGQAAGQHSAGSAPVSANMANQIPDTVSPQIMMQGQQQALQYLLQSRALDIQDKEADIKAQAVGYEGQRTANELQNSEVNRKLWQAQIDKLEKSGRVDEATIRNLDQMTANAVLSQKKTQQEISLLGQQINAQQTANQRADLAFKIEQATMNARIKSAWLDCGLKSQQIANMAQELKNFILDGKRKEFEIDIAGITASIKRNENGALNYDLYLKKKYGDDEKQTELQLKQAQTANTYISGVCTAINTGMFAIKTSADIAKSFSPLSIMNAIK